MIPAIFGIVWDEGGTIIFIGRDVQIRTVNREDMKAGHRFAKRKFLVQQMKENRKRILVQFRFCLNKSGLRNLFVFWNKIVV